MTSRIKDIHPECFRAFLFHPDPDLFFSIHMVERIAQIVCQYFFDPELVSPDMDRFIALIIQLRFLLLCQDLRGLKFSPDQLDRKSVV